MRHRLTALVDAIGIVMTAFVMATWLSLVEDEPEGPSCSLCLSPGAYPLHQGKPHCPECAIAECEARAVFRTLVRRPR